MIHSFPPVIDETCRVLILGSMPSVVSLERQQYYGHKQNYFWPMMFTILEENYLEKNYSDDFEEKKNLILRHNIALWDVLASCEREGSLDSNITDEVPNDIRNLLKQYPSIQYILFNGGKAFQSFKKHFPDLLEQMEWKQMPSTSPAHTMKREEKMRQWQAALALCQ